MAHDSLREDLKINWNFEYTTRKPDDRYKAEDRKLANPPTSSDNLIKALSEADASGLRPNYYSFSVLTKFLGSAHIDTLLRPPGNAASRAKLAFIDDRRDSDSVGGAIRNVRSTDHQAIPQPGTLPWMAAVDACGLYNRLRLPVSIFHSSARR